MGVEIMTRKGVKKLGEAWKQAGDRWFDAAKKVAKGTYTANELTTDVKDSFSDSADVVAAFLSGSPSSLLPVAVKDEAAASLTLKALTAIVVLDDPVQGGQSLTVSKLVLQSDPTKQLQPAVALAGPDDDQATMTLGPLATAPHTGIYHAVVLVDGKAKAAFVLTLT